MACAMNDLQRYLKANPCESCGEPSTQMVRDTDDWVDRHGEIRFVPLAWQFFCLDHERNSKGIPRTPDDARKLFDYHWLRNPLAQEQIARRHMRKKALSSIAEKASSPAAPPRRLRKAETLEELF